LENYLFSSEAVRSPATVDIFKLVHIGDSELKEPQEVLKLKNIRLVGSSEDLNVWLECIKPTSEWSLDIKVQKEVKNYLNKLFRELEEKNRDLSEELQLLKIVDNFFKDFIDFELERLDEAIAKSSESDKEAFRELKKFYQSFKAYTERYKNTCLIRLGKHTGRYPHTVLLSL
jgi:CRISPR type III-A-associated RAMP protein Csm5